MLIKRTLWLFFVLLSYASIQAAAAYDEREYEIRTHVVQPKETLYKISRQHGVSVSAIKTSNKLNSDIIAAGARLTIKIPKENDIFQVHIVRVSESLELVADKYELPMDILKKYNELDENVVFPGQRLFITIDKINTKYTYQGEEDQPVTDAEAGEVITAGKTDEEPAASGFDQADAISANPTPVYAYNPENRKSPENTDSLEKARRAFTIEGYMDAYYALASDKNAKGALNEFAMSAPRHNQLGLNTVQLAAIYTDTNIRGNITLQYGDMPDVVYPSDFKFLQQANLGFRIAGKLWFDAGFFKSPVSIEDFPNKANQSSIYSYTRYFEPVLFGGAKLGWEGKRIKLTGFVADRGFSIGQPVNSNFAYGLNVKVFGGRQWLIGANGMMTQQNYSKGLRNRLYTNLFVAITKKHVNVLAGINCGVLQKFGGADSSLSAAMMSATLNMQFKISKKFSLFARGEYFMDSSATVSPLITGTDGKQQGLSAYTYGGGFEFKARPNHYLRIEARHTQLGSNYKIYNDYFSNGAFTNQRWQLVATMGIWFGK